MHFREIGWEGVGRLDLDQDRNQLQALVNTVMNLRLPYKVGNFLTSLMKVSRERLFSIK
jgi:hypothetical protein